MHCRLGWLRDHRHWTLPDAFVQFSYYIRTTPLHAGKTNTLTSRIEPALKERLRAAVVQQLRSTANMIAVIRDYCGRKGVAITETRARCRPQDNSRRK